MNIRMEINAVFSDPNTEAQVVVLKNHRRKTVLPIWVGPSEANAIRLAMENVTIPRPLTHDLLKSFLTHLNVQLEKVVIHDVRRNTYYASLHFKRDFTPMAPTEFLGDGCESFKKEMEKSEEESVKPLPAEFEVDARPSDAIILSLRYGAPLYVAKTILEQQGSQDAFSEWLNRVRSQDSESSYNV